MINLVTVLQCAKMAAAIQLNGLGHVDSDVQTLIEEVELLLAPESVVEESAPVATDVVEPEMGIETPQEAPAEETPAAE